MQFKVRPLFKLLIDVAQDSRQKFNLTVSAETLVYKQVARIGKSSNGNLRSSGGLLEILGPNSCGPLMISEIPKSQSPFCWQLMACGVGAKFSPTWKVGGELHHLIRWSV